MRNRAKTRGFTLVELLVVIGIIALLISILLPALSKAKAAANKVKCMTQLKEIGNAFRLYSIDNRNYYPPAKLSGVYDIGRDSFTAAAPAYWINFVAKYVSKNGVGNAVSNGQQAADVRDRSVLWGCPSYEAYQSSGANTTAGFNVVQTGYGMNAEPYYSGTYPSGNTDTFKADGSEDAIAPNYTAANHSIGFIKANVWGARGAERALITEAKYWLAFAYKPQGGTTPAGPFGGGTTTPTYVGAQVSDTANQTTDGQASINFWRHGKLPTPAGTANAPQYDISRGTPSYNVLFADGHVATLVSSLEGFRAIRMK